MLKTVWHIANDCRSQLTVDVCNQVTCIENVMNIHNIVEPGDWHILYSVKEWVRTC